MPHVALLRGAEGMPASGSSIFTDAEGYQATLQDLLDLVVPEPRTFQGRLTWLDLPILHILRAQESAARVGVLRSPADLVFVGFPTRLESALVIDGVELHFGEVIIHGFSEIAHHRTTGACEWGSISLTLESLRTYSRIIAAREPGPLITGQPQRLATKARQRLLPLHRQAARLAETHLTRLTHPEVARALEQDLIAALVGAISGAKPPSAQPHRCDAAALVRRYEVMVAENLGRPLRIKDICSALDVSEPVFRTSCAEVLGMSPDRYQRLRRLKRVRAELLRPGASADSVREVLARFGFSSVHRFVTQYWSAYGEMPRLPPRVQG